MRLPGAKQRDAAEVIAHVKSGSFICMHTRRKVLSDRAGGLEMSWDTTTIGALERDAINVLTKDKVVWCCKCGKRNP